MIILSDFGGHFGKSALTGSPTNCQRAGKRISKPLCIGFQKCLPAIAPLGGEGFEDEPIGYTQRRAAGDSAIVMDTKSDCRQNWRWIIPDDLNHFFG